MNTVMNIEPGNKIEYRRPGARGRPTVAFVIEKNARSLTVERTTNHEVVKIKPSDVVRLAATGRRMKPTKAAPQRAPKPEAEVVETKTRARKAKEDAPAPNRRPAKRDMSSTVKELTGTGRRGRPRKADAQNESTSSKEASQPAKRRGRPRKNPA